MLVRYFFAAKYCTLNWQREKCFKQYRSLWEAFFISDFLLYKCMREISVFEPVSISLEKPPIVASIINNKRKAVHVPGLYTVHRTLYRYGYGGAGTVPALMAAGPGQFEEARTL
jgi:hypothetical protein